MNWRADESNQGSDEKFEMMMTTLSSAMARNLGKTTEGSRSQGHTEAVSQMSTPMEVGRPVELGRQNRGNEADEVHYRQFHPYRRMEMLVFDGSEPDSWIVCIDRYFDINRVPVGERLEAAVVAMDGHALAWWQWLNKIYTVRVIPVEK